MKFFIFNLFPLPIHIPKYSPQYVVLKYTLCPAHKVIKHDSKSYSTRSSIIVLCNYKSSLDTTLETVNVCGVTAIFNEFNKLLSFTQKTYNTNEKGRNLAEISAPYLTDPTQIPCANLTYGQDRLSAYSYLNPVLPSPFPFSYPLDPNTGRLKGIY